MTPEERLFKRLEGRINPFDLIALKDCAGPHGKERHDYGLYATAITLFEELLRLEREREWVKVTPETMPTPALDYKQRFLVICDGVQQFADYGTTIGGVWAFWREKGGSRLNKRLFPTHYRPLPAAPEDVEKSESQERMRRENGDA